MDNPWTPPHIYGPAPDVTLADIEWRIQGNDTREYDGQTKALFLAYFDARIAAKLMDEWVGPENWTDKYEISTIAGKEAMWCTVSVRVGEDLWVSKRDIGTASNFEAQKGIVSDALKRAVTKWGPGRNIYEYPKLWATCGVSRAGTPYKNRDTEGDITRQLKKLGLLDVASVAAEPPAPKPSTPKATTSGARAAKQAVAKAAAAPDVDAPGVDEELWAGFVELDRMLSDESRKEMRKYWVETYGTKAPSRKGSTNAQIELLVSKGNELLTQQSTDEEPF